MVCKFCEEEVSESVTHPTLGERCVSCWCQAADEAIADLAAARERAERAEAAILAEAARLGWGPDVDLENNSYTAGEVTAIQVFPNSWKYLPKTFADAVIAIRAEDAADTTND